MADRIAVMKRIDNQEINKTEAAKLLGVSRQRVTQLFKAFKKGGKPVETQQADTGGGASAEPGNVVFKKISEPSSAPKNLDEVLRPIGTPAPTQEEKKDVPNTAESVEQKPPPQPSEDGKGIDPEDAAAGRDLIRWFRRGVSEFVCRFLVGMKKDDPRLQEMRDENEFLKLAIKRNSEKAAPLGAWTKGFKGIIIGSVIEVIRGFFIVGDNGGAPDKVTPCKVKEDAPSPPKNDSPSDNADREEARPKRETLEEKIARANSGKI